MQRYNHFFLFAWNFANIIINGEAHLSFFECNCKISSQQYTTTTQLLLYEIHAAVPSYALYWYGFNIVIDVNLKNELKYSIFKRILSRCCTLLCWKWKCIWWMHQMTFVGRKECLPSWFCFSAITVKLFANWMIDDDKLYLWILFNSCYLWSEIAQRFVKLLWF